MPGTTARPLYVSGADDLKIVISPVFFDKFGVENRTELALLACYAGLHSPVDAGFPLRAVEEIAAAG